jgi:hypothetical protein
MNMRRVVAGIILLLWGGFSQSVSAQAPGSIAGSVLQPGTPEGNVTDKEEAKVIELRKAEEVLGIDILLQPAQSQ